MGLTFEFSTSPRIIFGNNSATKIPGLISGYGKRVILVTGSNPDRYDSIITLIKNEADTLSIFQVSTEPTTDIIEIGKLLAEQNGCEIVIGIGGGSVIDTGKAIAAMAANEGDLFDYLEVIGQGKALERRPLPFIAIPTTAGTGAEVTKNAVIHSPLHRTKVSLRSPSMFPAIALIDPLLTRSMPAVLTANTGMDALTHLLESFVSNQSNPFIDTLCREGLRLIADSLTAVLQNGDDSAAREKMSLASLMGGMALANVRLGAVHGFAGPIGGMFPVSHGAVCASLLPAVFEVNVKALTDRQVGNYLYKFEEIAKIFTGNNKAGIDDGIAWINDLSKKLHLPGLSEFGISEAHFPELIEKAKNSSSMKGNPVVLTDDELILILRKSV